jgi:uncharacterized membrane protein
MSPVLLLHISTAVVGLLSGFLSMLVRKGSSVHRLAGNIFFGSMLLMSSSAVYVAGFLRPNALNVTAGSLTFYLVCTGWWAAKRRDGAAGTFDRGALLFIFAVALAGLTFGFQAATSPTGTKDKMPAPGYFIFATVALLFAVSDLRMVRRGGFAARRIARHLWRMCLALLITTLSFYPGQAKLIPRESRSGLLFVPHLLLVGSMIYWMIRVRARKRREALIVPGALPTAT